MIAAFCFSVTILLQIKRSAFWQAFHSLVFNDDLNVLCCLLLFLLRRIIRDPKVLEQSRLVR